MPRHERGPLAVCDDFAQEAGEFFGIQIAILHRQEISVQAQHGGNTHGQMDV